MGQMSTGRDTPRDDYQSSPSRYPILQILAATLLVVAVRVAVTAAMAGGWIADEGPREATATARPEPRTAASASVRGAHKTSGEDRMALQRETSPVVAAGACDPGTFELEQRDPSRTSPHPRHCRPAAR